MRTLFQVLVVSEQRVPTPAASVAARCGEEGAIVEVKQNFLGNERRSLSLSLSVFPIDPPRPRVLQRRGSEACAFGGETEWIGEDGTVGADYCN